MNFLKFFFILGFCFLTPKTNAKRQKFLSVFKEPLYSNDDFCLPFANPKAPFGGKLRLLALDSFDTFYIFFMKGQPAKGLELLFATLFKENPDEFGVVYPYIAKEVEVTPTSFTFYLRKEACFHDDSPITAQDVVFTFEFMIKNSPFMASYYSFVKKAVVKDAHTVIFVLDNPPKDACILLSTFPIFSKKFLLQNALKDNPLIMPLGSGPYRILKFKPGEFIVYQKIKNWWGSSLSINRGSFNFETIYYDYFKENQAAFQAFKAHQIDVFQESIIKNWFCNYDFQAVQDKKVIKKTFDYKKFFPCTGFIFNTRKEIFQDIKVRQALSMMFDFDFINERLFFNGYLRLTSLFHGTPLQTTGICSKEEAKILNELKIDPTLMTTPIEHFTIFKAQSFQEKRKKALSLLKEAGFVLNKGILIHQKTKKPFVFKILLEDPAYQRIAYFFAKDLKRIGIEAIPCKVSTHSLLQAQNQLQFDMLVGLMSFSPIPGTELLEIYGSASANRQRTFNLPGIQNKSVDVLIQKILSADTFDKMKLYANILDRVLIFYHYGIPFWFSEKMYYAFWDSFGMPDQTPLSGPDMMLWWSKASLQ